MKDDEFDGLLKGLKAARHFARGRKVAGARAQADERVDVAGVRKATGLSQARFAAQIGVSVGTLRNWEQARRRPEGPARVLLALLARDPDVVSRLLGTNEHNPRRP